MAVTPLYENMSLEEFVNQPYIVQIYVKNGPAFQNLIKDIPYIRLGKIVRGDFAAAYIDRRRMNDAMEFLGTESVEMSPIPLTLLGRPSLNASTILQVQQQPYLDLRGRGTLIGIIDTGIDYTKEAFQYEDGTSKIRYIWDQTIEGNSPDGFLFGSEFTNEQINQALRSDNPYSIVPSTDTAGHGTFLASIAASRLDSNYIGAAPDAELLVVKLRRLPQFFYDLYSLPYSQENIFSSIDIMLAIDYMIDQAHSLGMPLVICIGLGTNHAGQDGSTILEQYMTGVSQLAGICICTGAGNESSAGHHASGTIAATSSTYDIQIRVPENANSFRLMIIAQLTDRMSVSLESPTGEIVPRAVAITKARTETKLIMERASIAIRYFFPMATEGIQAIIVDFFNPTPGIWKVILHGDIVLDGRFNAWLPITGMVTPGIQFLSPDPYTTVVTPATSLGSITSGAYNDRNNSLYANSSWGLTRTSLVKPDLVAPGVDVAGIYPMGNGTMTGTSVSAAITAGACALMLQWGIVDRNDVSLNTNRVKAYLIRGCRRDPNVIYPSPLWGYGKLDLLHTFRQLRSF